MLVAIHAVDYRAAGLGDFGHPDGYLERQVRRWGEQWERSKSRDLPAIEELAAPAARRAARRRRPRRSCTATTASTTRCSRPAIPGRIVAVLDWEMATLGDPLSDLGLFLVYWGRDQSHARGRRSVDEPRAPASSHARRSPSATRTQSGRDVSQLDFYEMLASYKLAIILEGIHARFLMGKTVGEGFDHIGAMVESIADAALDSRRRARRSPRCAAERSGPTRPCPAPDATGTPSPTTRFITSSATTAAMSPGTTKPGRPGRLGDEHDRRERHPVTRAEERGDPDDEEERVGAPDRDTERAAEQRARDDERHEQPADTAAGDRGAGREAAQHEHREQHGRRRDRGASAHVTTP